MRIVLFPVVSEKTWFVLFTVTNLRELTVQCPRGKNLSYNLRPMGQRKAFRNAHEMMYRASSRPCLSHFICAFKYLFPTVM